MILEQNGITPAAVVSRINSLIGKGLPTTLDVSDLTPRSKRILEAAVLIARNSGRNAAGTEHILRAIMRDNECYASVFLRETGLDSEAFIIRSADPLKKTPQSGNGSDKTGKGLSSTLTKYGRELTAAAHKGKLDPCLCREKRLPGLSKYFSGGQRTIPALSENPVWAKPLLQRVLQSELRRAMFPLSLRQSRYICLI